MPDRRYDIADLDYEWIGRAVVTLVVISRALGHASVAGSIRDYLVPHGSDGLTPEQMFAEDVILGRSPSMIVTDTELGPLISGHNLPPLEG